MLNTSGNIFELLIIFANLTQFQKNDLPEKDLASVIISFSQRSWFKKV